MGGKYLVFVYEDVVRGRSWGMEVLRENTDVGARFMTFAPEWLSGNTNLDTSNFMFM